MSGIPIKLIELLDPRQNNIHKLPKWLKAC